MKLTVACTYCETIILTEVPQLTDAQARELRAHLETCRPEVVADDGALRLSEVSEHFDVTAA